MALRPIIPVSVTITAANPGALNTAVATAVTTAMASTDYIPNSIKLGNAIVDTSNQALYQTVQYQRWGVEA